MKIKWKYAIGEIVIVIIGISIAFTLDNWKDERIKNQQLGQYLENLVLDMQKEVELLEQINETIAVKMDHFAQVRQSMGSGGSGRDTIANKVFGLAQLVSFQPKNTTYHTLINSGDLKLIKDFDLRRSIEEHYAFHSVILQNYERIEQIHQKYLGDFFIHNIDYQAVFRGNYDFLDDPLLINILTSLKGAYGFVNQGNQQCIKSNRQVMQMIREIM